MTKKLFAALLCLAMMFSACAEGLIAAETVAVDEAVPEEEILLGGDEGGEAKAYAGFVTDGVVANDGDFEIKGTKLVKYNGAGGDVVIPDGIVTIGKSAFEYCAGLTKVTFPSTVTTIQLEAFASCTSLTTVVFNEGLKTIGDFAFDYCGKLTGVSIPSTVTKIGEGAFEHCTSLKKLAIPKGVTTISRYMCYDCASLTSVSIPDGVTSIGTSAFEDCGKLAKLTLPKSVTTLGSYTFGKCVKLTKVTLPAATNTVGWRCFCGCTGLTDVTIKTTGEITFRVEIFKGCKALKAVHTVCGTPATAWAKRSGLKVKASAHVVVKDKAVPATYTKTGLTAGTHCKICKKVLKAQKVVPKLVAKKVKLSKTKAKLSVGKKLQLKATLKPAHSTSKKVKLTWTTSNRKVATVSKKGLVKAVGKGTATITVTTPNGKKATCKITVK